MKNNAKSKCTHETEIDDDNKGNASEDATLNSGDVTLNNSTIHLGEWEC